MRWYVVHAYSGFEKSVARNLIERIERAGMKDRFGEVLNGPANSGLSPAKQRNEDV